MSRVIIKKQATEDIGKILQPSLEVLDNKLRSCAEAIQTIIKSWTILLRCEILPNSRDTADVEAFVAALREQYASIPETFQNPSQSLSCAMPQDSLPDVIRIWNKLKESDPAEKIISSCAAMKDLQVVIAGRNLAAIENKLYGPWFPLTFAPSLDIREVITGNPSGGNLMTSVLIKLWDCGKVMSDCATSPDFCIENLIVQVNERIEELIKIPALSRCGDAIKYMLSSTNILRENINEYQADAVCSGNSMSFMHSYIMDVVKSAGNTNARLILQLKKIIAYIASQATGVNNKEHLKMLKSVDNIINNYTKENPPTPSDKQDLVDDAAPSDLFAKVEDDEVPIISPDIDNPLVQEMEGENQMEMQKICGMLANILQ